MFIKLFKYQLPTNPDLAVKEKLLINFVVVTALFSLLYILVSLLISFPPGVYAMTLNFTLLAFTLYFFLKKTYSYSLIANLYVVNACFVAIFNCAFYSGGLLSPVISWIVLIPIISLLLLGIGKNTLIWLAISVSISCFFGVFTMFGYNFPVDYNIKYQHLFSLTCIVGLILILYIVTAIFEKEKTLSHEIIREKQKEILDSITYAKKIQEAILPSNKQVALLLPESFVLYKPKDIVSGDFYWATQWGTKILFAAVDCTGHGVPGAFMSIVGQNLLNQAVNEQGLTKPNLILNSLNKGISRTLNQNNAITEIKDGMDIALCCWDIKEMTLEFAGAYNPLWILRNNEILIFEGDKFPVGSFVDNRPQIFKNNEIPLQKGDIIYIFTDGYADQFGGPNGKKLKQKQVKKTLLEIQHLPLLQQRELLNKHIEDWKGGKEEQLDDILFMGIKI
jgi:serine phosphatase RsbU (regulator of sigma subunit)